MSNRSDFRAMIRGAKAAKAMAVPGTAGCGTALTLLGGLLLLSAP